MEGHTGKISETNSECCPQETFMKVTMISEHHVNAYIHHCHDDATSRHMTGHTGRISQPNFVRCPQQAHCKL